MTLLEGMDGEEADAAEYTRDLEMVLTRKLKVRVPRARAAGERMR